MGLRDCCACEIFTLLLIFMDANGIFPGNFNYLYILLRLLSVSLHCAQQSTIFISETNRGIRKPSRIDLISFSFEFVSDCRMG